MPLKALGLGAALAALWGLGVAEFPRALEPGRAEKDRITLSFHDVRLDGSEDWWFPDKSVPVQPLRTGLRVQVGPRTIAVMSRNLAVFPHTCYSIQVAVRGTRGLGVVALDAERDTALAPMTPLARATASAGVTFSSGSNRSVVIGIGGTSGGSATLERAVLVRRGHRCSDST
jgi:hypothetical protein